MRKGFLRYMRGDQQGEIGRSHLGSAFFHEVMRAAPIADATEFSGPILVVTGRQDSVVEAGRALAEILKAERRSETLVWELDGGHGFKANHGAALVDKAIACSAGFFLR